MATSRLQAVLHQVAPQAQLMEGALPTFDELPQFKGHPGCAWGLWGDDDELGTVNILTPELVQRAAKEEMKYVGSCSEQYAG